MCLHGAWEEIYKLETRCSERLRCVNPHGSRFEWNHDMLVSTHIRFWTQKSSCLATLTCTSSAMVRFFICSCVLVRACA